MDIFSLFTLCGGVAFFLYGMSLMSSRLEKLAGEGKTVIVVTHDVEFAANYCEWMSMCFRSELTEPMRAAEFLNEHYFYTTAIHKITRDKYPDLVSERRLYES